MFALGRTLLHPCKCGRYGSKVLCVLQIHQGVITKGSLPLILLMFRGVVIVCCVGNQIHLESHKVLAKIGHVGRDTRPNEEQFVH